MESYKFPLNKNVCFVYNKNIRSEQGERKMFDYSRCSNRIILCVDLKSFYASCSCILRGLDPLKVKLAVVGSTERPGSVVLAATPLLKKMGIKQGSRMYNIPKRKDIIVVNPAMATYIKVSTLITNIVLQYAPAEDFHQYSIDEMFIDVTQSIHLFAKSPGEMAARIIKDIYSRTGITATVGIGPNLFLSKVALDQEAKKTRSGIARWTYNDVPKKLWKIHPLSEMWGISTKTEKKLNAMGIYNVGQLANHPVHQLKKKFGIIGEELYRHANGIDESRISEPYKPASTSIGKSQILLRDYTDLHEIQMIILEHLEEVCYRLRSQSKLARTVQFSIGYSKDWGGGFSRSCTIQKATNLTMDFYHICMKLFKESYTGEPIRSVSVSLTNFQEDGEMQLSLFDFDDQWEKKQKLAFTMDEIRRKYGKNSILRAISYAPSSTARHRNNLIGGHQA